MKRRRERGRKKESAAAALSLLASTTKRRNSPFVPSTCTSVFPFLFSTHHAARPPGDGARRQRRAGLVLLVLLLGGEARAPSPQQRRRPATTVRFVDAHRRPRRQRHRGGVQGRRSRCGRVRRQYRRLLHDRQGGRWMEREGRERKREGEKRKRATTRRRLSRASWRGRKGTPLAGVQGLWVACLSLRRRERRCLSIRGDRRRLRPSDKGVGAGRKAGIGDSRRP